MHKSSLYSSSKNRKKNVIRIIFKNILFLNFLLIFVQVLRLKYRKKRPINTCQRIHVISKNSFFINPVQEYEIEKLINNLNQNENLGPCGIPVKILKNHVDVLKQPLTYLINLYFRMLYYRRHSKLQE